MTTCENIRESLGAWLDGELNQADAEAIRLHVEGCSGCNEDRRQLEKLHASLKSMLESETSRLAFAPFWRGVQAKIAAQPNWYQDAMERVHSVVAGPRLAWAVPAAIILILGGLWVGSLWNAGVTRNNFAAVESIDAHGRNVALLREDETKTTVIWLYQEGEDESSQENTETGPSF
jgi:predicted anti-sigma-YlaC factor YlaD